MKLSPSSLSLLSISSSSSSSSSSITAAEFDHRDLLALNNMAILMMERRFLPQALATLHEAVRADREQNSDFLASSIKRANQRLSSSSSSTAAASVSKNIPAFTVQTISGDASSDESVDFIFTADAKIQYRLIHLAKEECIPATSLINVALLYNLSMVSLMHHENQHGWLSYTTSQSPSISSSLSPVLAQVSNCHTNLMQLWDAEEASGNDHILSSLLSLSTLCFKSLGQVYFFIGKERESQECIESLSSLKLLARELQIEQECRLLHSSHCQDCL